MSRLRTQCHTIPNDFSLHKTLKKIFDLRLQAIEKGQSIDWTTAESLAFGTLLTEGFSCKIIRSRLW